MVTLWWWQAVDRINVVGSWTSDSITSWSPALDCWSKRSLANTVMPPVYWFDHMNNGEQAARKAMRATEHGGRRRWTYRRFQWRGWRRCATASRWRLSWGCTPWPLHRPRATATSAAASRRATPSHSIFSCSATKAQMFTLPPLMLVLLDRLPNNLLGLRIFTISALPPLMVATKTPRTRSANLWSTSSCFLWPGSHKEGNVVRDQRDPWSMRKGRCAINVFARREAHLVSRVMGSHDEGRWANQNKYCTKNCSHFVLFSCRRKDLFLEKGQFLVNNGNQTQF